MLSSLVVDSYRAHLSEVWGADLPFLLDYVDRATVGWSREQPRFARDVATDVGAPTLIIVGERDRWVAELQAGAALTAASAVRDRRSTMDPARNVANPFQILFTGGCYGLEETFAERPALGLMHNFRALAGGAFDPWLTVDQMSVNTGHQARIIGAMIACMNYRRVVIVQPIEHIARFAATLAFDLVGRQIRPEFYFFGVGEWSDRTRTREHAALTRAREAFGPIQQPGDPDTLDPRKLLGGEYSTRYFKEQSPLHNRGYACGALSPADMLVFTVRR
ncbi:MAG: hypothetical protein AAB865_00645 [Patescibacteria group bacterium]